MKFTVDVDCTPQEARSFLGLPDVTPIHDAYIKTMLDTIDGTNSIEQMEKLFRGLSPMGDAGMKMFQNLMDLGLAGGGGSKKNGD